MIENTGKTFAVDLVCFTTTIRIYRQLHLDQAREDETHVCIGNVSIYYSNSIGDLKVNEPRLDI